MRILILYGSMGKRRNSDQLTLEYVHVKEPSTGPLQ